MTLGITDTFQFGKYRGELVGTIIEDDPGYIEWMLRDTDHRLDDDALEYLEECQK